MCVTQTSSWQLAIKPGFWMCDFMLVGRVSIAKQEEYAPAFVSVLSLYWCGEDGTHGAAPTAGVEKKFLFFVFIVIYWKAWVPCTFGLENESWLLFVHIFQTAVQSTRPFGILRKSTSRYLFWGLHLPALWPHNLLKKGTGCQGLVSLNGKSYSQMLDFHHDDEWFGMQLFTLGARRDTVVCLTSLNVLCRSGKGSFLVRLGLVRAFVNESVRNFYGLNFYEQPGGQGGSGWASFWPHRVRLIRPPLNTQLISVDLYCSSQTSCKIKVKNLYFLQTSEGCRPYQRSTIKLGEKKDPSSKQRPSNGPWPLMNSVERVIQHF